MQITDVENEAYQRRTREVNYQLNELCSCDLYIFNISATTSTVNNSLLIGTNATTLSNGANVQR
jgi:hypothetical protein